MRREDAIKKLGKILGKTMGYRVDPTAPDAETRAQARADLPAANQLRSDLEKAMNARRREILQADAQYQALRADYETAKTACDRLASTMRHYKMTVGTSGNLFFTVKAQGDSWEDVIAQLTADKTRA